jgi:phasin family protein
MTHLDTWGWRNESDAPPNTGRLAAPRMARRTKMATAKAQAMKTTKAVEQAAETMEQYASQAQEKMREGVDRGIAAMSEMGAFGKENMEAWIASATAASKGFEALSARAVAFSKNAVENHMAATKAILTSKSVQEVVERQSEYARAAFDSYVAELNKMSDLMSGLTKDAIKPINERMNAVGHLVQAGMKNGHLRG